MVKNAESDPRNVAGVSREPWGKCGQSQCLEWFRTVQQLVTRYVLIPFFALFNNYC